MANYCVNHILICGCEEAIDDMLKKELLVQKATTTSEVDVIDFEANLMQTLPFAKYITVSILQKIPNYGLLIIGESRWSPPTDAIKIIAKRYPEVAIYLHGYEHGVGYAYHLACEGVVTGQEDEYHIPTEGTLEYVMGQLGG